MAESLCELVSHQMHPSEQLKLLCEWFDQGIQFWLVLSTASENNQIIVGMFLGGASDWSYSSFLLQLFEKATTKNLIVNQVVF